MKKKKTKMKYCTYLTTYSGDQLPAYYIGSTSVKKIDNGYRGSPSSKKYKTPWKEELNGNPDLFKTIILNKFETRDEAYQDEMKWQTKLKVVSSELFVNMSVQTGTGFTTAGKEVSEETREKLRIARAKAPPVSEETRQKRSISLKGKNLGKTHSEETKAKISAASSGEKNGFFGKTHSEEAKKQMSESSKGEKNGMFGKTPSDQTRAKVSATKRERKSTNNI